MRLCYLLGKVQLEVICSLLEENIMGVYERAFGYLKDRLEKQNIPST